MLNNMILGVPRKLQSQFRLTYTMVLNLLRIEALKIEEMIKRSFSENISRKLLPEQEKQFEENKKALEAVRKLQCGICLKDIYSYYDVSSRVLALNYEMREKIFQSPAGSKSLAPGRVILVNNSVGYLTLLRSFIV